MFFLDYFSLLYKTSRFMRNPRTFHEDESYFPPHLKNLDRKYTHIARRIFQALLTFSFNASIKTKTHRAVVSMMAKVCLWPEYCL